MHPSSLCSLFFGNLYIYCAWHGHVHITGTKQAVFSKLSASYCVCILYYCSQSSVHMQTCHKKFNFKCVTHAVCLRQRPSDSVHLSHGDQSGRLLPLLPDPEAWPWTSRSRWSVRVTAAGWVLREFHSQASVIVIHSGPGKPAPHLTHLANSISIPFIAFKTQQGCWSKHMFSQVTASLLKSVMLASFSLAVSVHLCLFSPYNSVSSVLLHRAEAEPVFTLTDFLLSNLDVFQFFPH